MAVGLVRGECCECAVCTAPAMGAEEGKEEEEDDDDKDDEDEIVCDETAAGGIEPATGLLGAAGVGAVYKMPCACAWA